MASAAAVAGCAAVPGDDLCGFPSTLADGGCGISPQGDASTDGQPFSWDASVDVGSGLPHTRKRLCSSGCLPDDAVACSADAGAADANAGDSSAGDAAGDAGAGADSGGPDSADTGPQSCRVVASAGQQAHTMCARSGQGEDGASCTTGADCAPGFECVGTGTCRHYCCDDTSCSALMSNTADTYFCGILPEHAALGTLVPVCLGVKDCQLFGTDQCNAGQACTIVEINAGTSLVATCDETGNATLGQNCETAHCAAGYACLGAIGQRTCQELCNDQYPCPVNSTAPNCNRKSPALAAFNGVGVCGE